MPTSLDAAKASPRASPKPSPKSSPKPPKKKRAQQPDVADMFKEDRAAEFADKKQNYSGKSGLELLEHEKRIKKPVSPMLARRAARSVSPKVPRTKSPAAIRANARPKVPTSRSAVTLPSIRNPQSRKKVEAWKPDTPHFGTAFGPQNTRESSKRQAQRLRQEYAQKTRHMHKQVFADSEKQKLADDAKQKADQAERERIQQQAEQEEAEAAFKLQLQQIEAKTRDAIAGFRMKAMEVEKAARTRVFARSWKDKTQRARFLGPYTVPQNIRDLDAMLPDLQKSPKGAVAAFLLVLFRRMQRRSLGNELLLHVISPDCLQIHAQDDGSEAKVIRKHTFKMLHKISPETLASYIVGTSASSGYSFTPENIRFEYDNLATHKFYDNTDGATTEVFVCTTGAPATYPTSRPVHCKNHGGKWYVRQFTKLSTHVVPPTTDGRAFASEDTVLPVGIAKQSEAIQTFAVEKREPQRGFTPGLQRAVDFDAIRRRRRREAREARERLEEEKRLERQQAAKDVTSQLADDLAKKEMLDRWAENPHGMKRVVAGDGSEKIHEMDYKEVVRMKGEHDAKLPKHVIKVTEDGGEEATDGDNNSENDDDMGTAAD